MDEEIKRILEIKEELSSIGLRLAHTIITDDALCETLRDGAKTLSKIENQINDYLEINYNRVSRYFEKKRIADLDERVLFLEARLKDLEGRKNANNKRRTSKRNHEQSEKY